MPHSENTQPGSHMQYTQSGAVDRPRASCSWEGLRSPGRRAPGLLGEGRVPAVVGALGLDAAALGALVDDLPRLQLQALHVLFRRVSFGYCPLQFREDVLVGEKERSAVSTAALI